MSQFQVIDGKRPNGEFRPKCSVQLDNKKDIFTDFVVIGYDNNTGKTALLQNADAVTLGQGLQLITLAFKDSYNGLSLEDRALVDSVLQRA